MSVDMKSIALQALIPGLTYAVERALDDLNEARHAAGMPAIRLESAPKRGRPTNGKSTPFATVAPPPLDDPKPARAKRAKKGGSAAAIGATSAEHWRLVKEAGIAGAHRPSRADVERARAIIAKRAAGGKGAKAMSAGGS